MGIQSAGTVPRLTEVLGCAVYEARTGRIAHVHRTFRFEGADPISREALEAMALEAASRHHDRTTLAILHLEEKELQFEPDAVYAVDPQTRRLTIRKRIPLGASASVERRLPRVLSYALAGLLGGLF